MKKTILALLLSLVLLLPGCAGSQTGQEDAVYNCEDAGHEMELRDDHTIRCRYCDMLMGHWEPAAEEEAAMAVPETMEPPATNPKTEPVVVPALPRPTFPSRPAPEETEPTEPPEEQIPLEKWKGSQNGRYTRFSYDLDGDGRKENYLFGVDNTASPQYYEVVQDISGFGPGEEPIREIFPCVWRINSDGSREVEEAFTELLTDTQAKMWRAGNQESPDPVLKWVDYKWDGAVKAYFKPIDDASWIYEVKAKIGGKELTASALYRFIPRDPFPG